MNSREREHRSEALCCCPNSACLSRCSSVWQEPGSGLFNGYAATWLGSECIDLSECADFKACWWVERKQHKTLFYSLFCLFSWIMQEDYAGYDFENRLHVRIHSALASMRAEGQPWHFICISESTGRRVFKTVTTPFWSLMLHFYLF